MFINIFIENDDDTYIYGGRYFKALSNNGVKCEPFFLKDDNKIIAYYPSQKLFIEYINSNIVNIIYTMTCWSDDIAKYTFDNGVLLELYETYHGINNVRVSYLNGAVSKVVFGGKMFRKIIIGDTAPDFSDFFTKFSIPQNIIDEL